MNPKISLDQWRALVAVVEDGGFARAAQSLFKSQSAVSYAIRQIETLLGIKVFELQGRKAVLTDAGRTLYHRARQILEEAESLERAASSLKAGWEAEIRVAVDVIFPVWLMLECLARLAAETPHTRIELIESVLSGAEEALLEGTAELAICGYVPTGFLGNPLMRLKFVAVAHPDHPLHKLQHPLRYQDLRRHRQIVVRDSGTRRRYESGWLGAEQRWTVTNMTTSIGALCRGYGFAWLPEDKIRNELSTGELKPLQLAEGGERFAQLYLVFAERDYAGAAANRLAEILRETVAEQCSK